MTSLKGKERLPFQARRDASLRGIAESKGKKDLEPRARWSGKDQREIPQRNISDLYIFPGGGRKFLAV